MTKAAVVRLAILMTMCMLLPTPGLANPWNGKVVLQAFWWDAWNENYPGDWYTYLAKLAPRLKDMGFDGIWIPSPAKGFSGTNSMGYDIYDHYDLGEKYQKGSLKTRFGDKDALLRLIAVAHANGLDVYLDVVLNHLIGAEEEDPAAPRSDDRWTRFRYEGFAGHKVGRWPKDHWNFHPNPDHACDEGGPLCEKLVGQDICYEDGAHGGGTNGQYMRDQARKWFVWLKKQTDADGFRFDAVKHFPAYVVEDLLFNAMGDRRDYFAVGEFVGAKQELDSWCAFAENRAGTFDFSLRGGLASIVQDGGFFDMGHLPTLQQDSRVKTVPFINNHDTWRGAYWDSRPGSDLHDDHDGDPRQNDEEKVGPTINVDDPRADVSYAMAFAVDGSPVVFYEDLFINYGPERWKADPATHPVRPYVANLIWAHQKLNFKDGSYKVRHQGSQDLLVIERSRRAIIGMNDHGNASLNVTIDTDFAPHTALHDYSGTIPNDVQTDDQGRLLVTVPAMTYVVWGPVGIAGGFEPRTRRTVHEFQLDDDLGDARLESLGYGGLIRAGSYQTAGAVWVARDSEFRTCVYSEGGRHIRLRTYKPDQDGAKSRSNGQYEKDGASSNQTPVCQTSRADREGYHQIAVQITDQNESPTRAYVKVDYQAPAVSSLIK